MTKTKMAISKEALLMDYESTVYAMIRNKEALGLPDFMVEDLRKLREKTEEIREMEKLER